MLIPELLNKRYKEIYPNTQRIVETLLDAKHSKPYEQEFDWPDWCYLPLGIAHTIIDAECKAQGIPTRDSIADVGNLGAILNWRATKGIYRFDSELLESLWKVKLDKEIPVDLIFNRLPEYCCYIDLEHFEKSGPIAGFFVYREFDVNRKEGEQREIRICLVYKESKSGSKSGSDNGNQEANIHMTNTPFHAYDKTTIGDMLGKTWAQAKQYANGTENLQIIDDLFDSMGEVSGVYEPMFSLILYLCSTEPDVVMVGKPQKKRLNTKNPKKQKKNRMKPQEYRVGATIGQAIRRGRKAGTEGVSDGVSGGKVEKRTKSPHIRKAHFHLYWTGKGRTIPKLKFIAPVAVNIGEEPELPVVRKVKLLCL
jgi:hypothetical protein